MSSVHGLRCSLLQNWSEMQKNWLENPINFLSSAVFRLIVMVVLVGGDTGVAIWARYSNGSSTTGFAAHGGGFVAGKRAFACQYSIFDVKFSLSWPTILCCAPLISADIVFLGRCTGRCDYIT